jgi:putative peptidoglycan lipid II flippase
VRFAVRLLIAAGVAAGITAVLRHLLPGGGDDVSHVVAALRVVVLGGVDVVLFVVFAGLMRIREVGTVVDTILRRQRGRHAAS